METKDGYVYVVKVLNYYKIGKTLNPKVRFYEYAKLMEFPEIIYCTFVKDFDDIESKLHKQFKEKCSRGEWFCLDENDLKIISDILEQNKIDNDKALSLEEILRIHKKRENFIKNENSNQYKNRNNKHKIKSKEDINKVMRKKLLRRKILKKERQKEKDLMVLNKIRPMIEEGKIYKYKELCQIFDYSPTDGNSKKSQLKEWSRFINWEQLTTQKYLVIEIYDVPKEKTDGRKNNGNKDGVRKKERREDESK